MGTALGVRRAVARELATTNYDAVVFHSIAAQFGGAPRLAQRKGVATFFYLWDFFPIHHVEIGRVPSLLQLPLKWVERWSIGRPDGVFVMTPRNNEFLGQYHRRMSGRRIEQLPWSSDEVLPEKQKSEKFTVIFGGQLVEGRGVETLIRSSALLSEKGCAHQVLIAGSGRLAGHLEELARELGAVDVRFLGQLSRPDYLALLRRCDAGVAATVDGVSIPSFPSKISDYTRASLPMVIAAEASTDAAEIVREAGAGLAVRADDPAALASGLEELAAAKSGGRLDQMGKRAREFFLSRLSAAGAAGTFVEAVRFTSSANDVGVLARRSRT